LDVEIIRVFVVIPMALGIFYRNKEVAENEFKLKSV
jgi:hypothetical protein